jgi:hypothetical protein
LQKTDLIENQSNFYNTFESQKYGFITFYNQKDCSGKQSVILWYTFRHLVVNAMSNVVHFNGCNQNITLLFLFKNKKDAYSVFVIQKLLLMAVCFLYELKFENCLLEGMKNFSRLIILIDVIS